MKSLNLTLLAVAVTVTASAAPYPQPIKPKSAAASSNLPKFPSADVSGNQAHALAIAFDQIVSVETDKLRLWITASHQDAARVKEIVVWPFELGDLTAPLNFHYGKVETGGVTVVSGLGDEEEVTVTEDSASFATFTGRIKLQTANAAHAGDKLLQFKEGTTLKVSHGFGYRSRYASIKP